MSEYSHEELAIEHLDQAEADLITGQWSPTTNAHAAIGIGHALLAIVRGADQ